MLRFHFLIDDLSHQKPGQVNRVHLMRVYLSMPSVNNDRNKRKKNKVIRNRKC